MRASAQVPPLLADMIDAIKKQATKRSHACQKDANHNRPKNEVMTRRLQKITNISDFQSDKIQWFPPSPKTLIFFSPATHHQCVLIDTMESAQKSEITSKTNIK